MIQLERHIEILLLDNDCVIVPGLGGFMAHHIEARFDEDDNLFLPPQRTLGFNPQLKLNDSLLAQSYIEAYDISYPEAIRRIEAEVGELKQHLENEGSFDLNDIGRLFFNEEGNLEFEPCEAGILTPELYGLSSFEMLPIYNKVGKPLGKKEQQKEEKDEETNDIEGHAITIKMSWLRNAVAVAAACLAFFIMSTPVSNHRQAEVKMSQVNLPLMTKEANKAEEAEELNQQTIQEALTAVKEKPGYCIVLASQVTQSNAEEFVSKLQQKNIDARVYVYHNIRRVVCGNYATEAEAYQHLQEIHRVEGLSEAWVYQLRH